MKNLLKRASIVMCLALSCSCTQITKVADQDYIGDQAVSSGEKCMLTDDVFIKKTRNQLTLVPCGPNLVIPFSRESFENGKVSGQIAKYSKVVEVLPKSSEVLFVGGYRETSYMHVAGSTQVELIGGKFAGKKANANLVIDLLVKK